MDIHDIHRFMVGFTLYINILFSYIISHQRIIKAWIHKLPTNESMP